MRIAKAESEQVGLEQTEHPQITQKFLICVNLWMCFKNLSSYTSHSDRKVCRRVRRCRSFHSERSRQALRQWLLQHQNVRDWGDLRSLQPARVNAFAAPAGSDTNLRFDLNQPVLQFVKTRAHRSEL